MRLRSQRLGKATRPREQGCGEAAGCLQGTRRLPRLDWHGRYRDGIYSRWPGFASSTRQDSRGPGGNNASHRNAVSRFASHQIHSEVNLDMASLTQSGGAWPGGAHFCPPQFLSESSPMGSCLRVSDFRLYCYFLKKQKRKHTLLFLNVFLAATCVEKNSLNCFSDWSGSAFKQWNKLGKPYVWSHRDMTRN